MSEWFDAEAHADRAFEMFERGRWAEAESELRKALSLNPDQAEWHFNLGLTLEAAGREREALVSYERAIELLPDQPEPIVTAGILANRMNRPADALRWFDQALKLDARNETAYAHKIESHMLAGDHEAAETTFYLAQQALEEPSAVCLSVIAASLVERGLHERAAWCLKEALRLDPSLPRVRGRLGEVFARMDKPQRALQLFLRELRDDPGNIETLLDYGNLLMRLGRLPEAAEKFRRVLEIEPANVDAHMRLGAIAMRSGRYDRAHLEFELVFKLDPEYPHVRLSLAEALLARRRREDAQLWLRQELDHVTAAYEDNEESSDAEPREKLPRSYAAEDWARFGDLLLKARMPREAAVMFELALRPRHSHARLSPARRAELLRRLALAQFRSGNRASGVIASRRALRIQPRSIPSIHNLALAALEDDRVEVAAAWVTRGMKIDRHDDGLRRLRVRVWIARVKRMMRRAVRFGR